MLKNCGFKAKNTETFITKKKGGRKEGAEKQIALQTKKKRGRAQKQKKWQARFEGGFSRPPF